MASDVALYAALAALLSIPRRAGEQETPLDALARFMSESAASPLDRAVLRTHLLRVQRSGVASREGVNDAVTRALTCLDGTT